MNELAVFDEEGEAWPPPLALAAFLENYASEVEYNGVLVEVGPYLSQFDMFEVLPVSDVVVRGRIMHRAGEILYTYPRELRPLNVLTKEYVAAVTEAKVEVYDMEVYDLRDLLSQIGISITAESVAAWTMSQRVRVQQYARAVVEQPDSTPVKPAELP